MVVESFQAGHRPKGLATKILAPTPFSLLYGKVIGFCLDTGQECSVDFGTDEFLFDVRCVLLPG
jgi:hypothetical protein